MRLSVQLYTLRDHLAKDLTGTLKAVKEAGLEYVEIAGYYEKSAQEWKTILAELGLKVSGSHENLGELEGNLDAVIERAKVLDNKYVILPWLGKETYGDGWDKVGARIEPIGNKLAAAGLIFCYHNHAFEFEEKQDGKYGLDLLFSHGGKNLYSELDLAWVHIGGADPASYIKKLGKLIKLGHLKDYEPNAKPLWKPAGKGILKWDEILVALKETSIEFGCIELDESAIDTLEAVRQSVTFFKSKGLK